MMAPKVVAITGASGYIGSRLLQELEGEEDVLRLVAIDVRPLPFPIHNISVYRDDVSEPCDHILLQDRVTTVVHLAFDPQRGRSRREVAALRQANLDVLDTVLESCIRARVNHFIYLSSHTVYGAHPDNPIPLTDEAPLRPLVDFPYGNDKYASDLRVQQFGAVHNDLKVTILRPCIVLGPAADNFVTKAFFRPWLVGVGDSNPPIQFLYEDDLARVLAIIIKDELPGVYNVAGDGMVLYREMAKIVNSRMLKLPAMLAYPLVQLTWNLRIQNESSAAGLDLVRYPIVLSTSKLRQATGYRFRHTAEEALTAYANSRLAYNETF